MPADYEAEVIAGIELAALRELRTRFGRRVSRFHQARPGALRFRYKGHSAALGALRSVIAVYQIHRFALPRPKAFLGHQHFSRLTRLLRATAVSFPQPPRGFGIGAAGADSAVMRRLKSELAASLGIPPAADGKGQLYLRLLRRGAGGWEALLRISPQPLSKRGYRLADLPGALNATVAFAMAQMPPAAENATIINLCSGSSTILIEHAALHPLHQLIAIDSSRAMLRAGRRNAAASGAAPRIQHILADAGLTPLPTASAHRLYADLPFGRHIGSHADNVTLYPAVLQEAARLARPEAPFILLTHEVNLLRRCLNSSPWRAARETRIHLSGLHPRLFVLARV